MTKIKDIRDRQVEELDKAIEERVKTLQSEDCVHALLKTINAFIDDPYDCGDGIQFDDSGALESFIDLEIDGLEEEDSSVIESLLVTLTEGMGYFEKLDSGEWRLSQCLGEPVIYNESPERDCYAIYNSELDLKVDAVKSEAHGYALIEQAMRKVGVFENIVSTDYYGDPTLLSIPDTIRDLDDKGLQALIDKEENPLEFFIEENREDIKAHLINLVERLKEDLKTSPEDYQESPEDTPSIDIRLAVDLVETLDRDQGWTVWAGSSDYDSYHSEYCSASCVTLETEVGELLEELLEDLY